MKRFGTFIAEEIDRRYLSFATDVFRRDVDALKFKKQTDGSYAAEYEGVKLEIVPVIEDLNPVKNQKVKRWKHLINGKQWFGGTKDELELKRYFMNHHALADLRKGILQKKAEELAKKHPDLYKDK